MLIIAVINITSAVTRGKPEKFRLERDSNSGLCDTGPVELDIHCIAFIY